jgi:hypothetical protein
MASLPLSGRSLPAHARYMELFIALFLVLIALAAALGLVADSRDSADWKPSLHGTRASRWR